eukprot:TRINITY_DN1475_c0_g1_i1.p2 TRINITY_DN1475_c0_g1~~TRINITY_DN1475_c0_g1_i1.p2  ORF type:complete len:124 (-),score=4.48 TRINITY_DN1475_c0_g1_i1:500-871(-)
MEVMVRLLSEESVCSEDAWDGENNDWSLVAIANEVRHVAKGMEEKPYACSLEDGPGAKHIERGVRRTHMPFSRHMDQVHSTAASVCTFVRFFFCFFFPDPDHVPCAGSSLRLPVQLWSPCQLP